MSYADDNAETKILTVKESVLSNCRGRLISSISEEDVSSVLADAVFWKASKRFCLARLILPFSKDGKFSLSLTGKLIRLTTTLASLCARPKKNENSYDGAPNLIITGTDGDNDIKTVAAVCAIFKSEENFGSLRAAVKQVELYNLKLQSRPTATG